MNGVGYGVSSPEVTITADALPTKMPTPTTTSVAYNSIVVAWTALTLDADTGRDPIVYYSLEFFDRLCLTDATKTCTNNLDAADGSWTELTSFSSSPLALSKAHTSATKFAENSIYNYQVRAKNGVGWGPYSTIINVLTPGRPIFMNTPTASSISPFSITLNWVALDSATQWNLMGLDYITFYQLECDPATGTYTVLNTYPGTLVTTFT